MLSTRVSATRECERLDRRKFKTKAEARVACFAFIEGWYIPSPRHSALGYTSPINYERSAHGGPDPLSPKPGEYQLKSPVCGKVTHSAVHPFLSYLQKHFYD